MAHDDQFTALGPSNVGSGFSRAAFSTSASDMVQGVHVSARECGVYGETYHESAPAEAFGVGVFGIGGNFGVFGEIWRTNPSNEEVTLHQKVAGVIGRHNDGGIGVIGAAGRSANQNGIGVVGASLRSVGNPLLTFQGSPLPDSGPGIGVFGVSQTGQGVRGESTEAEGGLFQSDQGVGVRGSSDADRGGVFHSGQNVAQIRLVPLQQSTPAPELPKEGEFGDMLLIRNTVRGDEELVRNVDSCTLWICTGPPDPAVPGVSVVWRPVLLGAPVIGTL